MHPATGEIPRVVWTLWLQGKTAAPDLVRCNAARWTRLNPGHRHEFLDQTAVGRLLGGHGFPLSELTPQTISNLVRARLLLLYGGIWADGSVFPVRPLDDWLPDLLNGGGFFAFARPKPDRLISDWFLAATPDHPVLRELWVEITRFWSKPRRLQPGIPDDPVAAVSAAAADRSDLYPYFWFHYLFALVMTTRPDVAALWRASADVPAEHPHRLQFLFRDHPRPSDADIAEAMAAAPVQKLNWRATYPLDRLASLT